MVAFAASSAGFNASLILNITDLLLAGISTPAAQFVDPEYEVSPLANIFFVIPSAVVLSLIITAVTEFLMVKKARELVDHDHINYEEVSFPRPPVGPARMQRRMRSTTSPMMKRQCASSPTNSAV